MNIMRPVYIHTNPLNNFCAHQSIFSCNSLIVIITQCIIYYCKGIRTYSKPEDMCDYFVVKLVCLLFCSRSKDVVEPLIKPQWYVDCTEMAKEAVRVRDVYCVQYDMLGSYNIRHKIHTHTHTHILIDSHQSD